jgi:hypothetical protein
MGECTSTALHKKRRGAHFVYPSLARISQMHVMHLPSGDSSNAIDGFLLDLFHRSRYAPEEANGELGRKHFKSAR